MVFGDGATVSAFYISAAIEIPEGLRPICLGKVLYKVRKINAQIGPSPPARFTVARKDGPFPVGRPRGVTDADAYILLCPKPESLCGGVVCWR